jgi:hypothetical protein
VMGREMELSPAGMVRRCVFLCVKKNKLLEFVPPPLLPRLREHNTQHTTRAPSRAVGPSSCFSLVPLALERWHRRTTRRLACRQAHLLTARTCSPGSLERILCEQHTLETHTCRRPPLRRRPRRNGVAPRPAARSGRSPFLWPAARLMTMSAA